jgi:hypothetical protein
MSNYNKLLLSGGDKVFANGVEGTVVNFSVDAALVLISITIDGKEQIIKQWFKNDALKKIEPNPVKVTETKEKTIEFGVPGGSQKIVEIKKKKTGGKKK